ncbi:MAG: CNNM domain-containing protein [Planctomycetaceae bacterium]
MQNQLILLSSAVLLVFGVRLSAFFSGNETGFYRVSFLRLGIDAHAGDRQANQLIWFSQNPSYFVATTLVGNNIANWLTTVAIGLFAVTLVPDSGGWVEILSTLLLSPVVFVFGELIPKNLYLTAPHYLLRKSAVRFRLYYWLFLPISLPLVALTKFCEKFGRQDPRQLDLLLGRNRLFHVLSQGHREGLLTDSQRRLTHGVLHTAAQPVAESQTPAGRILGVASDCTAEHVLHFAKRYGLSNVAIRRPDDPSAWYGYVRVIDLLTTQRPLETQIRDMPQIDESATKLEALLTLRSAAASHGVIVSEQQVTGTVSERGMLEQLFRSQQMVGAPPFTPADAASNRDVPHSSSA